jgi:hypothetical protein
MSDQPEAIVVPPSANDTKEQMENFMKINNDNMQKSEAMQAAIDQVKANLEARNAEDTKLANNA